MSTERATCWSVTINNFIPADLENIALARQRGWKVDGQPERGEQGTPHLQLAVRTPQVRFSQVKKAFPRAHIEVARNPAALAKYVVKTSTRSGILPESQSRYPSFSTTWKLIYEELADIVGGPAEDDIPWDSLSEKKRLTYFDQAMDRLIFKGYYVDSFAMNPQCRGLFARFPRALLTRAYVDRQTDRQADLFSHLEDYNQDADSSSQSSSLSQEADAAPRWTEEEGVTFLTLPRYEAHEGDDP